MQVPGPVQVDVHELVLVRAPELVVTMEDVALVAATKVEETIENVVKVAFTATRAIISPIGHVFQKVWGGAPEVGEALCAGPRVRPALQQEPSADLLQSSPLRTVRPSTRRDSPWVEPPLRSSLPPGLELQVSSDADWVSIDQKPPPHLQKPSSPHLPKPPRGSRPLTPPLVDKSPPVPAPAMHASCCWALAREVSNVIVWCFIYFGTGAAFYMHVEGWNIWQSLYFLMVTASTVGYGDLKPNSHSWESRGFTVVYIIFGVCVVFAQLSSLITKCVVKPFFDSSRAALERRFPQLAGVALHHGWGGVSGTTRSRLPDLGRDGPLLWAHGYSGQGAVLATLAGALLAEAATGTTTRFDHFAGVAPKAFVGGAALRGPLFVLGLLGKAAREALRDRAEVPDYS